MIALTINGTRHTVDVPDDMPLLWVIREVAGLTGTKYGCGAAQCGCCMVHVDGEATFACVTPVAHVAGKHVVTVEGLSPDATTRLQQAWIAEQVPQCGYCQSGQLMSAAALLQKHPHPNDAQIAEAMDRNLCRCGTYDRVRAAIKRAASVEKA